MLFPPLPLFISTLIERMIDCTVLKNKTKLLKKHKNTKIFAKQCCDNYRALTWVLSKQAAEESRVCPVEHILNTHAV